MSRTAFIICHVTRKTGGLYNLKHYLNQHDIDIYELLHPLEDYNDLATTFAQPNGEIKTTRRKAKGVFNYLEDFALSVKTLRKTKLDIFIGCNNFDTLPAIFCRKFLGTDIQKIVYYPRDYSKGRFGKSLMNKMYIWVEGIACRHSDVTISNTRRAEKERFKLGLRANRSRVIPNPISLDNPEFKSKKIDKKSFIYVGDVSKEHGLYDLIEAIAPYIKKLVIIGSGKDWDRTTSYARLQNFELELQHAKDRSFVIEYLQSFSGIGLAPYKDSSWTYYCSPLKVGEYISCGVPVLVSSVPEIAHEIEQEGYGVTYDDLNIKDIEKKLAKLDMRHFNTKAKHFYETYSVENMFKELFK